METLESIRRRIDTAEQLHSLVRTMKALAAVNIRQFEQAVESLREYRSTLELALRATLRQSQDRPPLARKAEPTRLGAICCGTDQGMCGPLNDQVAAFVSQDSEQQGFDLSHRRCLIVGARLAARAYDSGEKVDLVMPVAQSASALASTAEQLLVRMEEWQSRYGLERIVVYFARHTSRASFEPARLDLLPIDRAWLQTLKETPWPTSAIPLVIGDPQESLFDLLRKLTFVSLYHALAETQASENASRLVTMRNAEQSIAEHLEELTRNYHQQRQSSVTEELLDIASGFEALQEDPLSP